MMTHNINQPASSTSLAQSMPVFSAVSAKQGSVTEPAISQLPQLLAQPRQDVLAVDGKIYVETSPEQLLYEKRRMMAKQHPQPAWVNNLVTSAIYAGVFSGLNSVFNVLRDAWHKTPLNGDRVKAHALQFAGYFATTTAFIFIANTVLQAINNKRND
jgi:hypothetical protein